MEKCPICSREFSNERGLFVHMSVAHPEEKEKRPKLEPTPKKKMPKDDLNYCPCCGVDLAGVKKALENL